MKMIGKRGLLAGAIGLLVLFPGLAPAQVPLLVEATSTDDAAPPHNVLCSPASAQVLDCLIWSPTGALVDRARPESEGIALLDISQVQGAETTMALALVVGGAGSGELTQQRIRNSLAVSLQGIGPTALVATAFAGDTDVAFGANAADMQRRLIEQPPVTDPEALAPTIFAAVDALSEIEGRPRGLLLAASAADELSERDITRLTRRLEAEGIVLTVVLLPSAIAPGEATVEDLPFANMIDTTSLDGALSGDQVAALPAFAVPTIRLRFGNASGLPSDGFDLAAGFPDGSRTEFRVSQTAGGVASIGAGGTGVLGVLDFLPRNISFAQGMQSNVVWIIALVAGGLIALYGLLQPRARKEPIDVSSLRQMRMTIEDAEVGGAASAPAPTQVADRTEASQPAADSTRFADETSVLGAASAADRRTIGQITFAGSGRVETLRDGVTRIGRLGPPDNDIVINETHISRRHAEIFRAGDGSVMIRNLSLDRDSQSRRENPVFVNGRQITADTALANGDEIKMADAGDTRFRVTLE